MARRDASPVSITDAPVSHSHDLRSRQTRYLLSMLVRTVCFVGAVVASGPLRWALIAAALFLPYIAVVLANAGSRRAPQHTAFRPEPYGALEPGPAADRGADTGVAPRARTEAG